jgi:hypothetical protein
VVLPRNSVGTRQIRPFAVTQGKLKRDSVTSVKVKDGALLRSDFKVGELPAGPAGPAGAPGAAGAQGPKGDKGDKGDAGLTPVTRFARVNSARVVVAGSPGTTAGPSEPPNFTIVHFDRDVSSCTLSAMGGAVDSLNTSVTRRVNAESLAFSGGSGNDVRVIMTDAAGSLVTSAFHLLVYC